MAAEAPAPSAQRLLDLGVDDWSALLAVALPVVRSLPDAAADTVSRRVAALPPGRLVRGRSRADLARVLVRPGVWAAVERAWPEDAERPWLEGTPAPAVTDQTGEGALLRLEQQVDHLRDREETLTGRVADLRAEVERLRRERDGAVARADAAAAEAREAREAADAASAQAERAAVEVAAADDRAAREVARARRSEDAELSELRAALKDARRALEERDRDLAAARDRIRGLERASAETDVEEAPPPRSGRRGRPSTLPEGMQPGTRRAAEWLVADGRELLVDGYNVTRTTRPDLSLAEQRTWLEQGVTALVQRRQVRATIVWDAAHGRPATYRSRAGVTVRFTEPGVTADDELVLHVELALDPATPAVVVTDDAELRSRLARHGVDLLDSRSFTWLL